MTDQNNIEKQTKSFSEIQSMIQQARNDTYRQTNKILIKLYWSIGKYVSEKINSSAWGRNIVGTLSQFLITNEPGIKGFSDRNIWRMRKFYETYKDHAKLSTLLTEISWSNHLHILSKTKTMQEKNFYLNLATKHMYSERDFSRLIASCAYERAALANLKLSAVLTEFPESTENVFKDSYLFEFTGISGKHHELDLQAKLLKHLKHFLLEMGPDFTFIKEQYIVQVGDSDYRIDLLLQHRGLNCLVAIELKVTEFQPEYLGKLQFYLEALDRDVKKPHENPSIGLLICKSKDEQVVEYAMSRNLSPAVIAEYQTQFINKSALEKKLKELSATLEAKDPILTGQNN
ncbi:MAG: PDDEXK nuclease domain-containing protein [Coxiellaceae bacterium]|nr:PDDEXK nuclease domain-containing protein [Coxiellaceae bacterium]